MTSGVTSDGTHRDEEVQGVKGGGSKVDAMTWDVSKGVCIRKGSVREIVPTDKTREG